MSEGSSNEENESKASVFYEGYDEVVWMVYRQEDPLGQIWVHISAGEGSIVGGDGRETSQLCTVEAWDEAENAMV